MTEAEKAYQYFVIAVPENEEQAKAYFWARKALQPTLTPPNEWVSRVQELDELYTKLQIATGFTAEQLLEMFAAGYTLEKPDYSKHFEAMANLAESDPPNEPLTLEQLREMDGEPVWVVLVDEKLSGLNGWYLVHHGSAYLARIDDWELDDDKYGVEWLAYRRPPEGEEGPC